MPVKTPEDEPLEEEVGWSAVITAVDIAWGALLTAATAVAAHAIAARRLRRPLEPEAHPD